MISNFQEIEEHMKTEDDSKVRYKLQNLLDITFMDGGTTTTRIFGLNKGKVEDENNFNTGVKIVNNEIENNLFNYINKRKKPLCIVGAPGYGLGQIRAEIIENNITHPLSSEALKYNGWVVLNKENIKTVCPTEKTLEAYNFLNRLTNNIKYNIFLKIRGDKKIVPWKSINATWETGILDNIPNKNNTLIIGIGGGSSQAFYFSEGKLKNIKDKKLGSNYFTDEDIKDKIANFTNFVCKQAMFERKNKLSAIYIFETGIRREKYKSQVNPSCTGFNYISSIGKNIVDKLKDFLILNSTSSFELKYDLLPPSIELSGVIADLTKSKNKIREIKQYLKNVKCNKLNSI